MTAPLSASLFEREETTHSGSLLAALLLLFLGGPYLPPFGLFEGRIRLDHLIVPLLAAAAFLRVRGRLAPELVPLVLASLYYMLALAASTLLTLIEPPDYYPMLHLTSLLSGADAYLRPFLILLLMASLRPTRADLRRFLGLFFWGGAPLLFLALLEVFPPTAGVTHRFLFNFYTNGRFFQTAYYLNWLVEQAGRPVSVFCQPSTLGMFCLLYFGLILAECLSPFALRRRIPRLLLLSLAFFTGCVSQSKVFLGGGLLLVVFAAALTPLIRSIFTPRRLVLLLATFALLAAAFVYIYAEDKRRLRVETFLLRLNIFSFETYYADRFSVPQHGTPSKIARTGAVDVALRYPATGLGLAVVGRTTDSFWLGLLIMAGVPGLFLFLRFLAAIPPPLLRLGWSQQSDPVAPHARFLLLLTIIFSVGALAFHTFIQDRVGDAYWILVALFAHAGGARPRHGVGTVRPAQRAPQ